MRTPRKKSIEICAFDHCFLFYLLEIKKAFKLFDKNGDGSISVEELGAAVKELGLEISEELVKLMIRAVDRNGNIKLASVASVSIGFPHVRNNFLLFSCAKIRVRENKIVGGEGEGIGGALPRESDKGDLRSYYGLANVQGVI